VTEGKWKSLDITHYDGE